MLPLNFVNYSPELLSFVYVCVRAYVLSLSVLPHSLDAVDRSLQAPLYNYTEKELCDPGSHDDVIIHLEPYILECEEDKWPYLH